MVNFEEALGSKLPMLYSMRDRQDVHEKNYSVLDFYSEIITTCVSLARANGVSNLGVGGQTRQKS